MEKTEEGDAGHTATHLSGAPEAAYSSAKSATPCHESIEATTISSAASFASVSCACRGLHAQRKNDNISFEGRAAVGGHIQKGNLAACSAHSIMARSPAATPAHVFQNANAGRQRGSPELARKPELHVARQCGSAEDQKDDDAARGSHKTGDKCLSEPPHAADTNAPVRWVRRRTHDAASNRLAGVPAPTREASRDIMMADLPRECDGSPVRLARHPGDDPLAPEGHQREQHERHDNEASTGGHDVLEASHDSGRVVVIAILPVHTHGCRAIGEAQ